MFVPHGKLQRLHIKFAITPIALAALQTQCLIYETPMGFLYGNLVEGEFAEFYGIFTLEIVVVISSIAPIYDATAFLKMIDESEPNIFNPNLRNFIGTVGQDDIIVGWYFAPKITQNEKEMHAKLRCQVRKINAECNEKFVANHIPDFLFLGGALTYVVTETKKHSWVTFFTQNSAFQFVDIDVDLTTVDPVFTCSAKGNDSIVDKKSILKVLGPAVEDSHERITVNPARVPEIVCDLPVPLKYHYFGNFVNVLFDGLSRLSERHAKEIPFPAVDFAHVGFDAQQLKNEPHLYIAARNSVDLVLTDNCLYDFLEFMFPYETHKFENLLKIKVPLAICDCENHPRLVSKSSETNSKKHNQTESSASPKGKSKNQKGKNKKSVTEPLSSPTILNTSPSAGTKSKKKVQGEKNKESIDIDHPSVNPSVSSPGKSKKKKKVSVMDVPEPTSYPSVSPKSKQKEKNREEENKEFAKEAAQAIETLSEILNSSSVSQVAELKNKIQEKKKGKDKRLSRSAPYSTDKSDYFPTLKNKIVEGKLSIVPVFLNTSDTPGTSREFTAEDISEIIDKIKEHEITESIESQVGGLIQLGSDKAEENREFPDLDSKKVNQKLEKSKTNSQKNIKKISLQEKQNPSDVDEHVRDMLNKLSKAINKTKQSEESKISHGKNRNKQTVLSKNFSEQEEPSNNVNKLRSPESTVSSKQEKTELDKRINEEVDSSKNLPHSKMVGKQKNELNTFSCQESQKTNPQFLKFNDEKEQKTKSNTSMQENQMTNVQHREFINEEEQKAKSNIISDQENEEPKLPFSEFSNDQQNIHKQATISLKNLQGLELSAEDEHSSESNEVKKNLQAENKQPYLEAGDPNYEKNSEPSIPYIIREIPRLINKKTSTQFKDSEQRLQLLEPDLQVSAVFKPDAFRTKGAEIPLTPLSDIFATSSMTAPNGDHSLSPKSNLNDFDTLLQLQDQRMSSVYNEGVPELLGNDPESGEETLSATSSASDRRSFELNMVEIPTFVRYTEKMREAAKTNLQELPSLLTTKINSSLPNPQYQMCIIPSLQNAASSGDSSLAKWRLPIPDDLLKQLHNFQDEKSMVEVEAKSSTKEIVPENEPENEPREVRPLTGSVLGVKSGDELEKCRYLEEMCWTMALESGSTNMFDLSMIPDLDDELLVTWVKDTNASSSFSTTSSMVRFCPNPQFFIDDVLTQSGLGPPTNSMTEELESSESHCDNDTPSYQINNIVYLDEDKFNMLGKK